MQRKAIRAVVGGSDRDIPIHNFLPNQFVFYDGSAVFTQVAVTPVGTPTPGHLAAWFTTSSIVDSGVVLGDVVTNPGTSVVNQLATFRDSTGKTIQAVTATVVGGAFTNVTTVNTRNVDDFITGPASSTAGDILTFTNTTGKAAQDSGVLATNIVTTAALPSTGQVAVAQGVGKTIVFAAVIISGNAISSVTTINGTDPSTWLVGPASAVSGNLASFNGTTGKIVQDSGIASGNIVTTTATPSANTVATFTGTGKAIQPVTVTISGGAIASVTTINSIDPSTWVVGPASSTNNRIAAFNGTTGKLLKDSGVLYTDVVVGPASAVNNNVALYSGTTGKVLIDGGVPAFNLVLATSAPAANHYIATWKGDGTKTIEANSLVDVSTVLTHASRHLPGGADSLFLSSPSFTNSDVPSLDSGGSNQFIPRMINSALTAARTVTSTAVTPTGAVVTLPSRFILNAVIEWVFWITLADTAGNMEVGLSWSASTTSAVVTAGAAAAGITSSGGLATFSLTSAPAQLCVRIVASVGTHTSTGTTFTPTFRKSAGSGYTVNDLGSWRVIESGFL